jgi:hypothetical protein
MKTVRYRIEWQTKILETKKALSGTPKQFSTVVTVSPDQHHLGWVLVLGLSALISQNLYL